jgi:hypothetical protein
LPGETGKETGNCRCLRPLFLSRTNVAGQASIAVGSAMQPLEPLRFVHLASPTALLFQGGRRDNLVPAKDFETVSNAASQPKQIKWYDAGHGLTNEAIRDQLEWLHQYVGTSSP